MTTDEQVLRYNEMVDKINAMSEAEVDELVASGKCPFQPELIPSGTPIGMFHCEICGNMVVAGFPHDPYQGTAHG